MEVNVAKTNSTSPLIGRSSKEKEKKGVDAFFFLFCLDCASTGTVTSQFPLFPLIAQHAARSGRVHDYMTLLSRAEK